MGDPNAPTQGKRIEQRFSPDIMQLKHNRRRVDRMDVWIDLAGKTERKAHHVRFVLLWIAYEAAYAYTPKSGGAPSGRAGEPHFLRNVSKMNRKELQSVLRAHRETIDSLLELRWANQCFWFKTGMENVKTAKQWEHEFKKHVRLAKNDLARAVDAGDSLFISKALKRLFDILHVVRNQIVHGASAGENSLGVTQVRAGAQVLDALVPCFRKTIDNNIKSELWRTPPFPHVDVHVVPDQDYPPPWLPPEN